VRTQLERSATLALRQRLAIPGALLRIVPVATADLCAPRSSARGHDVPAPDAATIGVTHTPRLCVQGTLSKASSWRAAPAAIPLT
jgi:hypothetical protein